MTSAWQYRMHVYNNMTQLSAVFFSQITTNEPNNSNIWCNCCNLYGILCVYSDFMSFCAEHMLMFPAALLITTGVIVIELLSHWCVRAGLHGLTAVHLCQRALGQGVAADTEDRETKGAHQRAPIRLFWNIYDACFQRKLKKNKTITIPHPLHCIFFFHNLAAASRNERVIHYIFAATRSRPSNRCLWVSHPSCVLEQILREGGGFVC